MSIKRHPRPETFHAQVRAREKQASREADAHALALGRRSLQQLRSENEAFASLVERGSIRLDASRSLG